MDVIGSAPEPEDGGVFRQVHTGGHLAGSAGRLYDLSAPAQLDSLLFLIDAVYGVRLHLRLGDRLLRRLVLIIRTGCGILLKSCSATKCASDAGVIVPANAGCKQNVQMRLLLVGLQTAYVFR